MNLFSYHEKRSSFYTLFSTFSLFVCLLLMPEWSYAQKHKTITLQVHGQKVETVFNTITAQTDYKFFFDQDIVNNAPSLTWKNRSMLLQ